MVSPVYSQVVPEIMKKNRISTRCIAPRKEWESEVTLGASLRRYERCSGSSGIISTPTATQTSVTTQSPSGMVKNDSESVNSRDTRSHPVYHHTD